MLEDNDIFQLIVTEIKNNQVNEKNELTKECKNVPGTIDINVVNDKENVELKDGHICINENNDVRKGNTLRNDKNKVFVPINDIEKIRWHLF